MSDKKALTRLAKHLLFEFNDKDVVDRFTLYDRPGPQINNLEATVGKDVQSTIGREVPLKPSVLMATQNFGERPPVEDDDYLPANRKELGNAASVISSMVPPDQIEFFYKGLHDLYDAAQDREGSIDAEEDSDKSEENGKIAKKEEDMKKAKPATKNEITKEGRRLIALLRDLITEASAADLERLQRLQALGAESSSNSSRLDAGYLAPNYREAARRLQKLGYNITAEELAADAAAASPPVAGGKKSKVDPQGKMIGDKFKYGKEGENWRAGAPAIDPRKSLEYMKNVLDYSSESGARQAAIIIKRRHDRIMALLSDPDASEALDDLLDVVKDDLFDILLKKKIITSDSANAWKKYPEELGLYTHPAFRNLIGKILDPLHKQEEKAIQDSIRLSVSKISVKSPSTGKTINIAQSGPVSDTVFNQVVGGSDPDFDNIKKRLMQKDGLNEVDAAALTEKIKKSFVKIRKDVGLDTEAEDFEDFAGEDILSAALDDWMKKPEKDKEKFVMSVSDALKSDVEMYNREKDYIEKTGKGSKPQDSSAYGATADERDESLQSPMPAYVPPAPGSAPESGWARSLRRDRERIEAAIAGRKKTKAKEEEALAKRRAEYESQGVTAPAKPRGRGRPPKAATVPATETPPAAPAVEDRVAPFRRKPKA
jgi:hypothetical protein